MSGPETSQTASTELAEIIDGRYRLFDVIGAGGVGVVYRAEHVTIRKPIAIKLLRSVVESNAELRARFEREAIAAGRLEHINCVTATDFGQTSSGTLYLASELVEGVSLADTMVTCGAMPWRRALHIARHILEGLASAHDSGIIHRDIKPENVMIVRRDDDPWFARILDFGFARVNDAQTPDSSVPDLTAVNMALGTPTYMSPEQAAATRADTRADLYSTAVVLFEMIAGQPPFMAPDKRQVLSMHRFSEPPTLHSMGAGVPTEVEQLLRMGLMKSAEDRYTDARQFIAAIDRIASTPTVPVPAATTSAQPPDPIEATTRTRRALRLARNLLLVGAAVIILVLASTASNADQVLWPPSSLQPGPVSMGDVEIPGNHHSSTKSQVVPTPEPSRTKATRSRARTSTAQTAPATSVVDTSPSTDEADAVVFEPMVLTRNRYRTLARRLRNGKQCSDRRAAIVGLRKLGDKRAIARVKRARRRMRGGLMGFGMKNTNACLVAEANRTIRHLRKK